MKLNFQLFDNFKIAAEKCNLEVKPGKGHYTIKLKNGRYIYCWTPLNKMWELYNYYEDKEYDRALKYLKDNFSDFHLEFGGSNVEDMNLVFDALADLTWKDDITVDQIVDAIETLSDDEKLNQKLVWNRLKYNLE
jgi:hypothetical protein